MLNRVAKINFIRAPPGVLFLFHVKHLCRSERTRSGAAFRSVEDGGDRQ